MAIWSSKPLKGKQGLRHLSEQYHAAFPHIQIIVLQTVVEEIGIATHWDGPSSNAKTTEAVKEDFPLFTKKRREHESAERWAGASKERYYHQRNPTGGTLIF